MTDNVVNLNAKRAEEQAAFDAKMKRIGDLLETLKPYFKAGGNVDELQRVINVIREG